MESAIVFIGWLCVGVLAGGSLLFLIWKIYVWLSKPKERETANLYYLLQEIRDKIQLQNEILDAPLESSSPLPKDPWEGKIEGALESISEINRNVIFVGTATELSRQNLITANELDQKNINAIRELAAAIREEMAQQRKFLGTIFPEFGGYEASDDTEQAVMEKASQLQRRYGISKSDAIERARQAVVYQRDGGMGASV
jgi:hypothetical protein